MANIAEDTLDDPLYSSERVRVELGIKSLITLRRRRKDGRLPEPVIIGGRCYWRKSVIEKIKNYGDGTTVRLPGETGHAAP